MLRRRHLPVKPNAKASERLLPAGPGPGARAVRRALRPRSSPRRVRVQQEDIEGRAVREVAAAVVVVVGKGATTTEALDPPTVQRSQASSRSNTGGFLRARSTPGKARGRHTRTCAADGLPQAGSMAGCAVSCTAREARSFGTTGPQPRGSAPVALPACSTLPARARERQRRYRLRRRRIDYFPDSSAVATINSLCARVRWRAFSRRSRARRWSRGFRIP
jgi:hypothetical protein